MAARKFRTDDRIIGNDKAPESFKGRVGTVVDFKGTGGYGIQFDDAPEITEYVLSTWISVLESASQTQIAGVL